MSAAEAGILHRSRVVLAALALLAPALALVAAPAAGEPDAAGTVVPFSVVVHGQRANGLVGVPASGRADVLVVLCHGFGGAAENFRGTMQSFANAGVMSVAMDYRGARGEWKVKAGYEDTIAATQAIRASHPEVRLVVLAGFSMGGEVSGLAVANAPTGTFDYWFAGVGVMDLAAEWVEVPGFRAAIEREAGGPPQAVADAYVERSPALLADRLTGKLRRAYLVGGAGDMVVPYEQEEEAFARLVAARVPVSLYTVLVGRNLPACPPVQLAACSQALPYGPAGHGSSYPLWAMMANRIAGRPEHVAPAIRGVVDGASGLVVPSDVPPVTWTPPS